MTEGPDSARTAVQALTSLGLTVATAESLTGGLVCSRLTAVPGASEAVRGAVVAYATEVKRDLLGVDAELLDREGPVHPAVAEGMAIGVARLLGADIGVATTGVAGPGPHDGHPAGTVYVAVVLPPDDAADTPAPGAVVRSLALPGDRDRVRDAASVAALDLLAGLLDAGSAPPASPRPR